MLTLTELHDITGFDDIVVPFSEKLKDGKVYYRTVTGSYINLTAKVYRANLKFHGYLRKHLIPGLKLIDKTDKVSFYICPEGNYYELKNSKLEQIDKETYTKRIKWIEAKRKKK